jgi:antitoxin CcdA
MNDAATPTRRPTNVTLPSTLIEEARRLGINLSQACEAGLRDRVAAAKRAAWLADNGPALRAWNDYVEEHGLPLAEFRQF